MYAFLGKKHTLVPEKASEEGGILDGESARGLLHEVLANSTMEALSCTEALCR
jgi:hypothetical protein